MHSSSLLYPQTPKNVDDRIIEPSPEFRSQVVKVLFSILLFILIYVVLVAGAVVLAALCGYIGIMMIITIPKFITLALGIGLMGVGVMVLFFLFKFVFKFNKVDRSNLIEISRKDHPQLFEFLEKVAAETQTQFPKRVYLSSDVNACVFYDSGFWSMFLPVRKNLQIGLGLVNSVNISEFKAIIAHEFGHFSQRSMKLGSYVYNVNKVIYNMLYDNEGYKNSLQSWANFSNYFVIFAQLTSGIVSGIQSILRHQYTLINKGYMALSRQMEFHADSVAASISGSKPLITSLRRFDIADNCYNRVLNQYDHWYKEHNRKAVNIYEDHVTVMLDFGTQHGLSTEGGIVQVNKHSFAGLPESRVIVKDQWSSHPSTDERENHLNRLNISSHIVTASAWLLFTDPTGLQEQVTSNLYKTLTFKTEPTNVEPSLFKTLFVEENKKYSFDPFYKGYYDGRDINPFELGTTDAETLAVNSLDELLTTDILRLPQKIRGIEIEIQMLKEISLQDSGIRTFEFNNNKFTKEQAHDVLKRVHEELDEAKAALLRADRSIFLLFHKKSVHEAVEHYQRLFIFTKATGEKISDIEDILREVGQLYQNNVTQDAALAISRNMTRKEGPIKVLMKEILNDPDYSHFTSPESKETLEKYLSKNWVYYSEPTLDSDAINLFVEAMNTYWSILSLRAFDLKKQTLTRQLEVVIKDKEAVKI